MLLRYAARSDVRGSGIETTPPITRCSCREGCAPLANTPPLHMQGSWGCGVEGDAELPLIWEEVDQAKRRIEGLTTLNQALLIWIQSYQRVFRGRAHFSDYLQLLDFINNVYLMNPSLDPACVGGGGSHLGWHSRVQLRRRPARGRTITSWRNRWMARWPPRIPCRQPLGSDWMPSCLQMRRFTNWAPLPSWNCTSYPQGATRGGSCGATLSLWETRGDPHQGAGDNHIPAPCYDTTVWSVEEVVSILEPLRDGVIIGGRGGARVNGAVFHCAHTPWAAVWNLCGTATARNTGISDQWETQRRRRQRCRWRQKQRRRLQWQQLKRCQRRDWRRRRCCNGVGAL